MKRTSKAIIIAAALSMLAFSGCNNSDKTIKTETFTFDDSSKYVDLSINAELPALSARASSISLTASWLSLVPMREIACSSLIAVILTTTPR